ncbi:uncharacterized protein LOC120466801 [Tachysurus ichikawai]
MLVKVKLGDAQKFVKITKLSRKEFLSAVKDPSVGVLTIKHGVDLESASPQASPVQLNRSSSIDSTDSQDTVIIEES